MKVLVCGGRNFADRAKVWSVLNQIDAEASIDVIIEGAATGADRLAFDWAAKNHRGTHTFPADWETLGPKAGPIRNQQMLDEGNPDVVVAFPGGRGTADMVRRAKRAGVRVIEVAGAVGGQR